MLPNLFEVPELICDKNETCQSDASQFFKKNVWENPTHLSSAVLNAFLFDNFRPFDKSFSLTLVNLRPLMATFFNSVALTERIIIFESASKKKRIVKMYVARTHEY